MGGALVFGALLVVASASTARAECAGHDEPRWLIHQSLVAQLNPMGAEHNLRAGPCVPLYDSESPVLSLNHFEGGLSTYVSPVYVLAGGYLQVAPVSFLVLRAELGAVLAWPIPLNGAGFFTRSGYGETWRRETLPHEQGQSAAGWATRLMAVLRGRVPIGSGLAIVALNALWLEHVSMDRGPYWVNLRDDVITAQADWVLANEAVLALGVPLPGGTATVRFGAFSALRHVPASGYVGHRVGPIAMLSLAGLDPALRSFDAFLRLGVYTHHRFRTQEAATLLGLSADWDLGGL